jgi:hypothetical protein
MQDETGKGDEQEMRSKHILLEAPAAEVNLGNMRVYGKNMDRDLGVMGCQVCLLY